VVSNLSRSRKKTHGTRAAGSRSKASASARAKVAVEEPIDPSVRYAEACRLPSHGQHDEARRVYMDLDGGLAGAEGDARLRALAQNDLAVVAAMEGRFDEARSGWQAALEIDKDCLVARLNRDLVEAELRLATVHDDFGELKLAPAPPPLPSPPVGEGGPKGRMGRMTDSGAALASAPPPWPSPIEGEGNRPIRVAILSFLFNWPSTGGGNHHTAEPAHFLARAGYEVKHFFAQYPSWGIGRVTDELISPSEAIAFDDARWNVGEIQARYRGAVEAFTPDYAIITDSWNMKPLLAEAMRGYPYFLLYQAQENICPLNNLRLLASGPNQVEQCPRNQLATPDVCCRCLAQRGRHSGALHRAERELAGVGTQEYYAKLRRSLSEAEAVVALNPVIAAMLEPYSSRVRVVPWGMDAARFPWPVSDRERGSAFPSLGDGLPTSPTERPEVSGAFDQADARDAEGAGAKGRPLVDLEGGVERAAPSADGACAGGRPTVETEGGVERPAPSAPRATLFMAAVVGETIKGYHVAHEACRILRQTRSDFELVVTFDPAGQIDEFTRSVGWCSLADLPRYYRAADICLVPTIAQDSLSRTSVEAMASGIPVVASRIGGLPYTVTDGVTGLLCEPGDPVDLARQIARLLDDPALRRRMGPAGRKRFEEDFVWEDVIERYFRPLLAERRVGSRQ
jgi:glycosyltransferase involved in cell wall biosynthesis